MFAVGGIACFGCILSSGLKKEDNTLVCHLDPSSLHSKESQDVRRFVDNLQANFLLSLQSIQVPAEQLTDAGVDRKNANGRALPGNVIMASMGVEFDTSK